MEYTKIHSLNVEFEDIDSYKIAHHTKLVAYLERARVRLLKKIGLDLNSSNYSLVLYDLEMKFQKPALFLDAIDIWITIEKITAVKLVLAYKIKRNEDVLLRASTTLSFIDKDTKLIPMPNEVKEKIEKYIKESNNE